MNDTIPPRVIDSFLTDWIRQGQLARSTYRHRPGEQLRPEPGTPQLDRVPVDRLFTNKASGKDTQRPELKSARLPERALEWSFAPAYELT